MRKLKIDPRFAKFLPKHTEEESASLESLLLVEGCRDAIVVWAGRDIIVDGHTRYGFCVEHDIPFSVVERDFADEDAVIEWMASNQLGRRNLTDQQRRYYLGKHYLAAKKAKGNDDDGDGSVRSEVAAKHGVSERTVHNSAEFAENLDKAGEQVPEFKQAVIDGEIKPTRADVQAVAEAPKRKAKKIAADVAEGKHVKPDPVEPAPQSAERKVFDATGRQVSDRYAAVFESRVDFAGLVNMLKSAADEAKRISDLPGGVTLHLKDVLAHLKSATQEVSDRTPHSICPECQGAKPKGCKNCSERGWLDVFRAKIGRK